MNNEEMIFIFIIYVSWINTFFVLWCWQKSRKFWYNYTEEILDDWEKSSVEYIKKHELLIDDYNNIVTKYNNLLKEYSSLEDDCK